MTNPDAFGISAGAEVSVLIPAYAAESFIDRTLACARAQTEPGIVIMVSVDCSGDRTLEHVERHANEDSRIRIYVQEPRLGWTGNVNFLLDRIATPYFFLYFHDDIIEPTYVAKLLEALKRRPDAASANCDVGYFGASSTTRRGLACDGRAVERILKRLLTPSPGALLRSMTRSALAGHLRLRGATAWTSENYVLELVAVGPAIHVAEKLYSRWARRKGGVTEDWRGLLPLAALDAHRANLGEGLRILEQISCNGAEWDALRYALVLNLLPRLRQLELIAGRPLFATFAQLHPELGGLRPPVSLATFGPEIQHWADERWQKVGQAFRDRTC